MILDIPVEVKLLDLPEVTKIIEDLKQQAKELEAKNDHLTNLLNGAISVLSEVVGSHTNTDKLYEWLKSERGDLLVGTDEVFVKIVDPIIPTHYEDEPGKNVRTFKDYLITIMGDDSVPFSWSSVNHVSDPGRMAWRDDDPDPPIINLTSLIAKLGNQHFAIQSVLIEPLYSTVLLLHLPSSLRVVVAGRSWSVLEREIDHICVRGVPGICGEAKDAYE